MAYHSFSGEVEGVEYPHDTPLHPISPSPTFALISGNKGGALTGQEWRETNEHAYQLQALATLVSLGGTGQADKGWVTSPGWQEWAGKLRDAGVSVKRAVDAKNQMALRSAGDALVDTCEGCHKQFKPDVPTEGILHVPHAKDPF
jgi:hypothetical protein